MLTKNLVKHVYISPLSYEIIGCPYPGTPPAYIGDVPSGLFVQLDKITDAAEAVDHIQDGTNLFISGFTAGYPKLIPKQLVRRANEGERFKINVYAGASTGDAVDGILSEAGIIGWRRPYMSNRSMRELINKEEIAFKDDHLSRLSAEVRAGNWGVPHVAVVEAVAITEKGHLIPTLSVGNTPTYVREAQKIIIEISSEPPMPFII